MRTSVVIPTHNRCELLRRALDSVWSQSLPVDEVIVVDDGSTDSTPKMLADEVALHPNLKVIRFERGGGAPRARNAGIDVAGGTWIAFLDSDDIWLPTKHARQMEAIRHDPDVIACFSGSYMVSPNFRVEREGIVAFSEDELRTINMLGTTSSAMVRRDRILEVGGFDAHLPSCQDWDLWLRLYPIGRFVVVPDALIEFNQESADRISRNIGAVVAGHRIVFARALDGIDDTLRRRWIRSGHFGRLAEIYRFDLPKPAQSFRYAVASMVQWPTPFSRYVVRNATRDLARAAVAKLLRRTSHKTAA